MTRADVNRIRTAARTAAPGLATRVSATAAPMATRTPQFRSPDTMRGAVNRRRADDDNKDKDENDRPKPKPDDDDLVAREDDDELDELKDELDDLKDDLNELEDDDENRKR